MHRMVIHRTQIDEANPNSITKLRYHRLCPRKNASIHREDIEIRHLIWIRAHRADINTPFAQHQSEIAINTILRLTRMNYEQTHQTKSHLRHFIMMGVIHVRAVLPESELILERLTRLDRRLCEAADAIHSVRQNNPVPMNASRSW